MFSSITSLFSKGSQTDAPQQDVPEQLRVSRIITYPIKSCAGIELQESQYSIEGLTYDRKWMVIDAHTKRFITARTHPKLFLVKPAIDLDKQCLQITIPSHGTFSVPLKPTEDCEELSDLEVWSSQCCGRIVATVGSALQAALSEFIGTDCLLVHASQTQPRLIGGQRYINDLFGNEENTLDYPLEDVTTLFADGYPFLIATEATFRDVAKWLEQGTKDVRMELDELVARYRPNIVIAGAAEGFIEEAWEAIRIGDDTIYPISRCPRCPMPDASPKDGTMSSRRLPGKIVEAHRSRVDRIHKGPCLGMNAISKARSGAMKVGSTVEVLRSAARTEGFPEGRFTRVEDTWS